MWYLLLTAERAELGGSLARGNGRGLGHAALVVAGFLELSVDNFLEMGFVALHGGGAEVGGVLIGGLMVFDPVRQLPAVGRTSHGCGVIWGQAGDGRCAGVHEPSECTVDGVAAGAGDTCPCTVSQLSVTGLAAPSSAATSSSSISTLVTHVRCGIG